MMAWVVRSVARRPTSIGCHLEPIAVVVVAAIHEYTEKSRYCSWARPLVEIDAGARPARPGSGRSARSSSARRTSVGSELHRK